jgi:alanine-synthesizing transaminase
MVFSDRVPDQLAPNRIASARAHADVRYDLTVSNPTACGFAYPVDLFQTLSDRAGFVYRPEPRGLPSARALVAHEYLRHGVTVDPENVVLTASTSEAYSFIFKLLCNGGDAVLAPVPSYPLFEHLARVETVRIVPYDLDAEAGWRIRFDELLNAPPDVRAVIVVHPNNPTGSFVHPHDLASLRELAIERDWALVADEVFLDYPLADSPHAASCAGSADVLTFTLGGLSKSVGLPQLKLAWIVAAGPGGCVRDALDRLEFIADTFLSVATPVQLALPHLLRAGSDMRAAIQTRCRQNLATLLELVTAAPAVRVLPPAGGWSAVLRIPTVLPEEEFVIELLTEAGVAVQPGFFFDFPQEGYLVVSLLPEPAGFREGIARVLARLQRHLGAH